MPSPDKIPGAFESEDPYAPGTMGCHEALHMTSVAAAMVEEYVEGHPAIQANPEWLALAEKATDALGKLYGMIGAAHLGK